MATVERYCQGRAIMASAPSTLALLRPADLPAALDRLLAQLLGGRAARRVSVAIDRTGDHGFDVSLVVDTHPERGGRMPPSALGKLGGLGESGVRAAVEWFMQRRHEGAAWGLYWSSRRWVGRESLSLEGRAAEVMRVFGEVRAVRVVVSCGRPVTRRAERGEDPTGQPRIRLELSLGDGATFEEELAMALTSAASHTGVESRFLEQGRALAETFGVPCDVTGGDGGS